MTAADTIAFLRAAIDAGDDSAIPPLADALEEAQDTRAAGLRLIGDRRPGWGDEWAAKWYWLYDGGKTNRPEHVTAAQWLAMTGCSTEVLTGELKRCYHSRSEALLSLAGALVVE